MSDDDKFQVRIDPRTALSIMSMERAGIKRKDIIAAAIAALQMVLARNGKCGGSWKSTVLSEEQQGKLAYQKLLDALEDSEGWYKFKAAPVKPKKKLGRPKRVKPVDPILAEFKMRTQRNEL